MQPTKPPAKSGAPPTPCPDEQWVADMARRALEKVAADTGRSLHEDGRTDAEEKWLSLPQYDRRLMNSCAALHEGAYAKAAQDARMAISLDPSFDAHVSLGSALSALGDYVGAVRALLQAMELAVQRGAHEDYNFSAVAADAFVLLTKVECAREPRPSWWNEPTLRAYSAAAVGKAPDHIYAWVMRAFVLMRHGITQVEWNGRLVLEEAEDLREARRCWQQAAKLATDSGLKEDCVKRAAECLREAEQLEKC